MFGNILSLAGVLLCVAAILFLAYWCTRRLGLAAGTGVAALGKHMRVVDRLALSQDKQIILAQVGSRWLVLGLSSGNVQLLTELTQEEAETWRQDMTGNQQTTPGGFGELLRQTLRNRSSGK